MREELGIAIIGCGYWGVNYVRTFTELSQARVVVICDQREKRLQEIGARFPDVGLVTSVAEALHYPEVDAVVVCTEASSHYTITRQAILAQKHVLVEKPLTTNSRDADELTVLAESVGVTLMVGHTFIYNNAVRRLKEYVNSGDSYRVHYLYSRRTNLGPIRRDVNAIWDLAAHDVSIFNYLLDSVPEWVSAVGAKVLMNCREDVGFISLGYPDGILGHIHVSWADPNKVREVVVVGSDKRIVFNDLDPMEPLRVFEKGVSPLPVGSLELSDFPYELRDGDIISPRIQMSEPLKNQCVRFLDSVARRERPLTGGKSGADVVRVLEAIDKSVALRGAPVQVE